MRKIPKQERSRLLVESIIDATAIVIAKHGLAAATTARITDEVGISIGSLYQYFDNKEDLYEALLERIVEKLITLVEKQSLTKEPFTLSVWVTTLLNDVWDFLEADNGLYLQVVRNWSQLDFVSGMDVLEQKMLSVLSVYLLQQPTRISPNTGDLPARLYILTNSILFTLLRYISKPSPLVSRQTLIAEFANMVERSLL
ncbi:MAG: TetR/AcrR family transcriptional regulator [Agitococcus sp.]|nr:TetR/AcrR family transcriptional regulator [Agitococcus sp.]